MIAGSCFLSDRMDYKLFGTEDRFLWQSASACWILVAWHCKFKMDFRFWIFTMFTLHGSNISHQRKKTYSQLPLDGICYFPGREMFKDAVNLMCWGYIAPFHVLRWWSFVVMPWRMPLSRKKQFNLDFESKRLEIQVKVRIFCSTA